MAFQFPANPSNGDTIAGPNGLQYTFDSSHGCWTVILTDPVYDDTEVRALIETEKTRNDTQDTNIGTNDVDIANLQSKVTELEEQQGEALSYTVLNTAAEGLGVRAGEMVLSSANPTAVTFISLASVDNNGTPVSTPATGDTVYLTKTVSGVKQEHRYVTTDDNNSAQTMLVEMVYTTGQTISAGDIFDVYVYPTNTTGVTSEYVDDADKVIQDQVDVLKTGKVDVAGDTMTGRLILKRLGSNQPGFTVSGRQINGTQNDANLLQAYHNASEGDAVNYFGLTLNPTNIQTKESVDALLGGYIPITGGRVEGALNFYTGNTNKAAIQIYSEDTNERKWYLWQGTESETKYRCKDGSSHWFQVDHPSDGTTHTPLKITYDNLIIGNETPLKVKTIQCANNTVTAFTLTDATYLGSPLHIGSANSQLRVDAACEWLRLKNDIDGEEFTIDARTDCVNQTSFRILINNVSTAKFKVANGSHGCLEIFGDDRIQAYSGYNTKLIDGTHTNTALLTTKGYVDSRSVDAVELHNSNSPPSNKDRGTLLMTNGNQLYVYT